MENKFIHLTQSMIIENPKLSGAYLIQKDNPVLLIHSNYMSGGYIFLKDGQLHNSNGPAYISLNLDSVKYIENGKFRGDNLPSIIDYSDKGFLKGTTFIPSREENYVGYYYDKDGLLHCVSGPAYRILGGQNSEHDQYWIHGKGLSKEEWMNHSEVRSYLGETTLKKKMKQIFGEKKSSFVSK